MVGAADREGETSSLNAPNSAEYREHAGVLRQRLIERQVAGGIHFSHAAALPQGDQPVTPGDNRARREAAGSGAAADRRRRRRSDRLTSSTRAVTADSYWRRH